MVEEGFETSVYLRKNIARKTDEFVAKNKDIYISRSQLINSLLYKFLREKGLVPEEEEQRT